MPRYADVALPVNIDRPFTYLVPPDLESSAIVGVRAIVPFGRKYATGMIVGLPATTEVPGLKPLRDILDPVPIMSEEMLALCRWIASYYFSPLGDVLKAAMPQGFSRGSKRTLTPGSALTPEAVEELRRRAPRKGEILAMILEKGEMDAGQIEKKTGAANIHGILNALVHDGYLLSEELLAKNAQKARTIPCVDLDGTPLEKVAEVITAMPPRKKKARALLEALMTAGAEEERFPGVKNLLVRSGVTLAAFREIAREAGIAVVAREADRSAEYGSESSTLLHVLNTFQQETLTALTGAIDRGAGGTFLLHGVTGSGKTQVYIEAIKHCRAAGKTAIVLVPEISLTPQMVRRFMAHFGDEVVVIHSRMSQGERQDAWRRAHAGGGRIVIGPRSAIFAPLTGTGLIVVDEEHEASYKQFDSSPRYHARDVAVMRGALSHTVVVLGSATPSAESCFNADAGKYTLLRMPERIDAVPMPSIAIVDMTAERKRAYAALKESLPETSRGALKNFVSPSISGLLKEKIEGRLALRQGIILLQNRRGFAPFVECGECGYVEMCDDCNITLTYHSTRKHLRCHYCGLVRAPHITCPTCLGSAIALRGIGTQRVEEELHTLFPAATVLRMDVDTTSTRGAHHRILTQFGEGKADILLGTQMVAKGLDFARVTLVGVISADTQMLLPDFRASERTFQLLTQVAGRAGRSVLTGEVIIQTHQPDHMTLRHVVGHDFRAFYDEELAARKELDYPPFSRMALVETRGSSEEEVRKEAEHFAAAFRATGGQVLLLGPAPAVIGKIKREYRWHVVLKSLKNADPSGGLLRHALQGALGALGRGENRKVRMIVDVDPVGLM
jgi:primosomal protein N' (replication factor Y) (superfamily II helicase)